MQAGIGLYSRSGQVQVIALEPIFYFFSFFVPFPFFFHLSFSSRNIVCSWGWRRVVEVTPWDCLPGNRRGSWWKSAVASRRSYLQAEIWAENDGLELREKEAWASAFGSFLPSSSSHLQGHGSAHPLPGELRSRSWVVRVRTGSQVANIENLRKHNRYPALKVCRLNTYLKRLK